MDQNEELEEGEVAGEEIGPESQDLIAMKQKKKAKKAKRQVGDKVSSPPESRASTTDSVEKIEKKVKLDKPYTKKNKNEFVSSTYKTRPCEFYRKGACQKGDDCTYSHDFAMGKPDVVCKFHLTGNCSKGDGCMFSHDLKKYPCKFFWGTGNCTSGMQCRFSHEPMRDEQKIMDFIEENEEFFMAIYQRYNRTNLGQYFLNYLQKKNVEKNKDSKSQFLLLPPGQEPAPFYPPGQNQFPNQHPNQPPGLGHPPFANPPQQGFDPNNPNIQPNIQPNVQPNMQPNMPPSMHPMQYNNPQGNQQFPGKPGFYDQNAMSKPRFMQPPPPTQNFQGKPMPSMPMPGHQQNMPGHQPSGPGPNFPTHPFSSMPPGPGQGFQPQNPQFNPQNQYNQGPMNQMNQGGGPMYQQPNPMSQGPHPHLHPHLNHQMQMQQQQQPQMQPPQMQQQPLMQPPHMQVQQQQQQYPPQQPQLQPQPQHQQQQMPPQSQPQPRLQPQPQLQHQHQPQLQQMHMQQPPMQMHQPHQPQLQQQPQPQPQPHMHQQQQQQQQFPQQLPQQHLQQPQIPQNQMHQPFPQNVGNFPTPQKNDESKDFIPFNEPAPQFRPNTFPPNPQPIVNQFPKGPQDHIGGVPEQQLPPNDPRRRIAQQSVTKNIPNMGPPMAQFENTPQKEMSQQAEIVTNNPFLMSRGASHIPNQMPNINMQPPPQLPFPGNIPIQPTNRSDIKPEEIKLDKGLNDSFIPFGGPPLNIEPKHEMPNIRMDEKPPAPPMMMGQNFPKEAKASFVPLEMKQNIEPRISKTEYSKTYNRPVEEAPTKRLYTDMRRPSKKSTVPAPNLRTKSGAVLTPTRSRAQSGQFSEEKSSQRIEKEKEYFNQNALLQKLGISKKKELNKVEVPGDIEKLFSTFEFYSEKTVTPLKSSKEQVSTSIAETLKSLKEVFATE